nr:hypothetical protein CFP56_11602 [Quercus suber]
MKALRLPEEYQYVTTSDYSATISEPPVKGIFIHRYRYRMSLTIASWTGRPWSWAVEYSISGDITLGPFGGFKMAFSAVPQPVLRGSLDFPCFLQDSDAENDDFRGREDILGLIAAELLPSKTDMAAVDTVFWVIADETARLDEHFQQISLALGLENSSESKSQVVSREIVKGWLSHPYRDQMVAHGHEQFGSIRSEATWLLVFDNADDPMVLADYWPQGKGSILITSRDPQAKHMFSTRSSGMDLGPLPPHDSLSLFYHLTHVVEQPEDEVARRISNALGGCAQTSLIILNRQHGGLLDFHLVANMSSMLVGNAFVGTAWPIWLLRHSPFV